MRGVYKRKPFSEEHLRKLREARKGRKPNLGHHHSDETKARMSEMRRGEKNANFGHHWSEDMIKKCSGENNVNWIHNPSPEKHYFTIHKRFRDLNGKADHCENPSCEKTSKQFVWSNKDHKYSMNKEDWQQLCHPCHIKYDFEHGHHGNEKITRDQVREIRERFSSGKNTRYELSAMFGVTHTEICYIISRKTWKHVI